MARGTGSRGSPAPAWRDGHRTAAGLVGLLLLLAVGGASAAPPSPWVGELQIWFTRYHEAPGRLDEIRRGLLEAASGEVALQDLLALAQVSFIWGDVRAPTPAQKLEAYDQGRQAARRAIGLEPGSAAAHFWLATNTARWGEVKGLVRSLFLLSTVRDEIRRVIELDPGFTAVYALAGRVDSEVPALLGGDLDRAETMFRKGLAQDPRFTGMRVELGRTLIKKGRLAEARGELEAVLAETEPSNRADWAVKDAPEARALLASTPARP